MIRANQNLSRVALVLLCCSWSVATSAQVLEEVVVTAQKREESIQDVPISITALTGSLLRELGARSSDELAQYVPNLEWLDDGTNVPQIFIRGIGDISIHLNQQGGVGMYADEVSLNSPVLRGTPLFDLERVEVLRGPQNTLFGLNTTGGAIHLISRKPRVEDGANGFVDVGYASLETATAEVAFGTPLGDSAAIRIAASGTWQSDWKDNVTLGREVGGYDQFAARAQLAWQASDDVDVLINFHAGDRDGDRLPDLTFGSRDPANPGVVDPGCAFEIGNGCADSTGYVMPTTWDEVAYNINGQDDVETVGGFVNVQWQQDTVTLTSVTAFEDAEALTNGDSDGGPLNILAFGQVSDTSQWSQEFRLASASDSAVRWMAGLYYFNEDADWGTFLRLTPPPVFAANGGPRNDGPQAVANNVTSQEDEVWSVYGHGEFPLSDALNLTFGLRYTSESKQADVAAAFGSWTSAMFPADRPMGFEELALVNAGVTPALAMVDETWDEVGGKLALDYHYSNDVLVYGSIARGFKGGGTSLAAIEGITGNPGRVIDPETLWSYEVGAKTSWLDNRVNLNVAVFYNDWNDQQLFTAVVSPDLAGTYLINVPESRSYGAEAELQWQPAEGWYLAGGLALLNAELEQTTPEYPNLIEGNTLPNSPEFSLNGLVRREWEMGGGLVSLQSTFSYKDDVQYDIAENPVFHEDGFWLVNVRASYRFGANQEYEVAVFGDNLTDTEYCMQRTDNVNANAFSGTGRCTGNPGEPIFGVTARVEF